MDNNNKYSVNSMMRAKKNDSHLPNYWTQGRNNTKYLVPVDEQTKQAIKNIVEDTWTEKLAGEGNDAKNLYHKNINVILVQRVENPKVFMKYQKAKNRLLDKMIDMGEPSRRINDIRSESKGDPATTKYLQPSLKSDLSPEINESYVLHGTKVERIGALTQRGFNIKRSDPNALFGKGIYTTDSSTKADQYADDPEHRRPLKWRNKLILSRVLLGNVYLSTTKPEKDEDKLTGPPCMTCLNASRRRCHCNSQKFDSVLGERQLRFREFVTYDDDNIYPEYVITYKRTN
ncbi:hypothetical protein Btru_066183 [Bulinus truncatus]|nr:hypothetical protein Btru_066183 [Bulinus truncatus]